MAWVAAHGLPTTDAAGALDQLDDVDWSAFLERAVDEHITGHLVAAIDDGSLRATEQQWSDAVEAHERALALDLVLERLLRTTSRRFLDAGIEHRALKGPAVAHTAYDDPCRRSYGDVDILVRGAQFDDAVELLTDAGGRARYREPRPGFTQRFGKGVCVVTDGLEIDVHRTFVAGPFGLALDPDQLFCDPVSIRLGSVAVPTLPADLHFLHACYHASLGDRVPRLVTLRDIAEMCMGGQVDHHAVIDRAKRWRARIVVQRSVLHTWATLALDSSHPLLDWALRYRASRWERNALAAYITPARSYALQSLAGLRAVRGSRAKAAYASALLLPTHSYAQERGGYVARWMRTVSTARQAGALR
jgi:hypothetical protein